MADVAGGGFRFDDEVVIVTGAGNGLGRAYAHLLASRGAKIVVNDIGERPGADGAMVSSAELVVKEITGLGGTAVAHRASVATRKGGADLAHQNQQAIAVTVDAQVHQFLQMAAALALDPERRARARPIGDATARQGARHRLGIHPGHHQHLTACRILRDGRDQPAVVVFQREGVEGHGETLSICGWRH